MNKMQGIMDDFASLKEAFESMATCNDFPVLLLPIPIYNALWDQLRQEGFLTAERWRQFRGDDIHIYTFTIRRMPEKTT